MYEWKYEWYKGTDSVMSQTSERYNVIGDTLSIIKAITSDQDQYWCRGQRDGRRPKSSHLSSVVSLTVTGELNIISYYIHSTVITYSIERLWFCSE